MFSETRRAVSLILALLLTVSSSSNTCAGNNAGGRVYLSWDRAGVVYARAAVPTAGASLYLHLLNAPDVQQLAATIRWTTDLEENTAPCYALVSSSAPADSTPAESLYGWAVETLPGLPFLDDPSYTWSIQFPAGGGGRDCVRYTVTAAACDSAKHAVFMASRVVVMDSAGRVDTLLNVNYVKVAPIPSPPLMLHAVYPQVVTEGQPTQIAIDGAGFEPGAQVSFRQGSQLVESGAVLFVSDNIIAADVPPSFGNGVPVDLIVEQPSGTSAVLSSALLQVPQAVTVSSGGPPWRPSNDARAFTPVSLDSILYEPGADPQDNPNKLVHEDHPHPWPANLNSGSGSLLISRGPDTPIALVPSRPYGGLGFHFNNRLTSTRGAVLMLKVNPPVRATSIGMLLEGGMLFNSTGGFQDAGKQLMYVGILDDGFTRGHAYSLDVGSRVRNWQSGGQTCGVDSSVFRPYYDLVPTDSLVVPFDTLVAGQMMHYDFQEIRLPAAEWGMPISTIMFEGRANGHIPECGGGRNVNETSSLYGVVVWPEFEIVNRAGQAAVRLTQGSDTSYGGFYRAGRLMGTRKTLARNGCTLTCYAMAHNYFGLSLTPDSLNNYLQLHDGYAPDYFTTIASVSDTLLMYKRSGSGQYVPPLGDTMFVVDGHERRIAIAVVRDTSNRIAALVETFVPGASVVANQRLANFGLVDPLVAGSGFPNSGWRPVSLPDNSAAADSVEEALRDSLPVILKVKNQHHKFAHFVLATGWEPAFFGNAARGTYTIKDPGFPAARLIDDPHENVFRSPRKCERLRPGTLPGPQSVTEGTSSAGDRLLVTLQGGATLNLEDPQGFTVRYDPDANYYRSDVPGLSVIREEIVDDEDDTTLVSSPVDLLSLQAPATGTYLIYVQSDRAQQVVLSASPFSDQGQGSGGSDVLAIGAGQQATYQLDYSASPTPTATLQRLRVASVGTRNDPTRLTLRTRVNPSRAACAVSYRGKSNQPLEARIFDVRGRCLRVLALPSTASGGGEMRWDGRTEGGLPAPAGVYFIRVRQGNDHAEARIVLLR
jgi:hypothetical protein